MNKAHLLLLPLFILMLPACQVLQGKPEPAPAPADHAIEIRHTQSRSLEKTGAISVTVHGSPDDAERAIQQKANAYGAHYYVIVTKTEENARPGVWYARAVLYR